MNPSTVLLVGAADWFSPLADSPILTTILALIIAEVIVRVAHMLIRHRERMARIEHGMHFNLSAGNDRSENDRSLLADAKPAEDAV
jgi:hypothetical protein